MKLFEPFYVNKLRLENRLVLTAMVTRLSGEDGYVNDDIRERYLRFARGEVGLIVMEAMGVHSAKSGPLLRLSEDRFVPGLRDLISKVHGSSPSKIVPQIIHFLKISRSGWRQKVQDLSHEEMRRIVELYGQAAGRARAAGFDGVELHMAHAYTLSSFLSRHNLRPDEYGRSLENRLRLPSEVILRCRQVVGPDFPIGVRFDGEECIKGGYSVGDAAHIALRMAQLGVDYISLSAGGKFEDAVKKENEAVYPYTGYSGDRTMPSADYPDAYNTYIASHIKRFINERGFKTPVITTGKIPTAEVAEGILQSERADLIGMARTLLADPDWPVKVRMGREDKVFRCIYGNVCKALDENFQRVVCVYWPRTRPQAPTSQDTVPPQWPAGGAQLKAKRAAGRVHMTWEAAQDNEGVYGYEIYRSDEGNPFRFLMAVRGNVTSYFDATAIGGFRYAYYIRAYDFGGNRSEPSQTVEIAVPLPAVILQGGEARR